MSFPAYPNYQESGDPLLGPLPSHWSVSKIKWYTDVFSGYDATAETGVIPVYGANGILGRAERPTFYADRVLIGRVGSSGTVNLARGQFCVSDNALVVDIRRALNCRYVYYWALSQDFSPDITTTSQPLLTGASVKNYRIGFPEYQEQQQIADFLDHETARIDALIEEQQRLIKLLEEDRNATIYSAVTNGLDPSTPMQDSGSSWLGLVPAHWTIGRLKDSVLASKGGIWGEDAKGDDSDISCVRVADFDRRRFGVSLNNPTIRSVSASERRGRILEFGDLLLEKSGGGDKQPVGCVVRYEDTEPAVCANFISVIRLKKDMDSSFWRYVHCALYSCGGTIPSIKQTSGIQNIDHDSYFDESVAYPDYREQKRIANHLDDKVKYTEDTISEAQGLIDLLRERRSAVISAAVTGKVDVREWERLTPSTEEALPQVAEKEGRYG